MGNFPTIALAKVFLYFMMMVLTGKVVYDGVIFFISRIKKDETRMERVRKTLKYEIISIFIVFFLLAVITFITTRLS